MSEDRLVTTTLEVSARPPRAFEAVIDDLRYGLSRKGFALGPGPLGRIEHQKERPWTVTAWEPETWRILEWRPCPWKRSDNGTRELRFEPSREEKRATFEVRASGAVHSDEVEELSS